MFGKCVIDTPKQFGERTDKAVNGITSLYLPAEDVSIEADGIKASPRIKILFKFTRLNSSLMSKTFLIVVFQNGYRRKVFLHTVLWGRSLWSSKNCC